MTPRIFARGRRAPSGRPHPARQLSVPSAARRAAGLLLLMGLLVAIAAHEGAHAWLTGFLPSVEALIRQRPVLGVSAFVAFAALSAMLAFVSSAVVVPAAVFTWGAPTSLLLLWVGWVVGGMLAYAMGRFVGRRVVDALSARATVEAYEQRISQHASFGLVLLLQMAMPSEVPSYLLGLIRYPFGQYVAALALAEIPYAAATIYLGAGFVERRTYQLVAIGVGIAAFSGIALYELRRRLARSGSSGRHASTAGAGSTED